MRSRGEVVAKLVDVIRREVGASDVPIDSQTAAADVPGWDSLAHTRIIMAAEAELGVVVDVDMTYRARNIGELADLFCSPT